MRLSAPHLILTGLTAGPYRQPAQHTRCAVGLCLGVGCAILIASLGDSSPATAQAAKNPGEVRRALEERRQELDSATDRADALRETVSQIEEERAALNQRLLETGALIQKSEARLTDSEQRLGELGAQEGVVRGSLVQRHRELSKLLAALQRMGRNPPPVVATKREDALSMVRSAILLSSAFPGLKTQATALSKQLSDLTRVMTDIRGERTKLREETDRLTKSRAELSQLITVKKQTLAESQTELKAVRRAAADISRNVTDLNQLIVKLDEAVTEKTALGAYEREVETAARAPTTPITSASPNAPGFSAPKAPQDLDERPLAEPQTQVAIVVPPNQPGTAQPGMIEMAPSLGTGASPGRMKPALPFQQARAKLPLPAQGRRIVSYGEKTQYGGRSKGMVIETRASAQITSPSDGWVVYAGAFRSYGQLLIINAGGGYHILLAGLSQIDVQPGQFVLAAEPVGTMASAAGSEQQTAANAPVLYIEFRKDGRPINPDPWWVASRQKVLN